LKFCLGFFESVNIILVFFLFLCSSSVAYRAAPVKSAAFSQKERDEVKELSKEAAGLVGKHVTTLDGIFSKAMQPLKLFSRERQEILQMANTGKVSETRAKVEPVVSKSLLSQTTTTPSPPVRSEAEEEDYDADDIVNFIKERIGKRRGNRVRR
jgi:hypothetical protein